MKEEEIKQKYKEIAEKILETQKKYENKRQDKEQNN